MAPQPRRPGQRTARHPRRQTPATWVGWAGGVGPAPAPARHRHAADATGRDCPRRNCAATTRGSPTRRCGRSTTTRSSRRCSTAGGGRRTETVNRRFAEAAAEVAEPGARGLGAGLPPAARPADAPGDAARPADRLLPARAVPAAGALHAAPPPGRTAARDARRRPGRLPAAAGGAQRRPARGQAARRRRSPPTTQIVLDGRVVRTGAFPVSIDVAEMRGAARPARRAGPGRASCGTTSGRTRRVLLSVDRLDYTKGIEHRLTAYSELLRDGRVKVRDTVMVQVAVPSRERVESYRGPARTGSSARSAGSTASTAGSASPPSTTSTSRSTGPNWPRSTRPPT